MRALKIEKMLEDIENIDKVLEEIEDDFEIVDTLSTVMKSGITNNGEEAKDALNKVSGALNNLNLIYYLASTKKKEVENKAYQAMKMKCETDGIKFVSAAANRYASKQAQPYRRLRNIVKAYRESCENKRSSLQTVLNFLKAEMTNIGPE